MTTSAMMVPPDDTSISSLPLHDNAVTLPTRRASAVLATVRLASVLLVSVVTSSICTMMNIARIDPTPLCHRYYALIAWIVGIRVVIRGTPSVARPTLVVANHVSYLDVFALGGRIKGRFIAKADILTWPVIGYMVKSGGIVFINRSRTTAGGVSDEIRKHIDNGETLIMFPESTSHDGNRVRPFKSALFAVAERPATDGRPVAVQPVSVAYTRLNGLPMGVGWRPFFAWYGDMDLIPHAWHALRLGRVTTEITFHAPVTIADFGNRKALAAHCEQTASAGVARLLAGRESD